MNIRFVPTELSSNSDKIKSLITHLGVFWNAYGPQIEKYVADNFGLVFKEDTIDCVVGGNESMSNPLTIKECEFEEAENTLVHELIHVLFTQNYAVNPKFAHRWDTYWNQSNYKDEKPLTKSHIPVHALHILITQHLLPKRIDEVKYDSIYPEYKKSWDIVLTVGPEKILSML